MLKFFLNFLGGLSVPTTTNAGTGIGTPAIEVVEVQVQAEGGYWMTMEIVYSTNSQQISMVMDGVSVKNPGKRVRAVVQGTNRIIDIR